MTPWRWVLNNTKALDVLFNTSVLASSRVETFSRRAGLARKSGKRWGCVVCALLDRIHKDHCQRAVEAGEIV